MDDQSQQDPGYKSVNDLEYDVKDNGPKTREQLVQDAYENGAPSSVRAAAEQLPEGKYYNAQQVDDALKTGTGPQDDSGEEAA